MIESFSPTSRKIIAVGLVILTALLFLSLVLLPYIETVSDDLTRLNLARGDISRLQAIAADGSDISAPPVSPGLYIMARNPTQALAVFAGELSAIAARHGVSIQLPPPNPAAMTAPALLSLQFQAQGDPGALVLFLNDVERGGRLVRFSHLAIMPAPPSPGAPPVPGSTPGTEVSGALSGAPPSPPPPGSPVPPTPMAGETPTIPPEAGASAAGPAAPASTAGMATLQATALVLWGAAS